LRVVLPGGEPIVPALRQLAWDGSCRLSLQPGGLMTLEPLPGASLRDASLAASGAGLALELERRSLLVLHGSCVAIDGQGVCLLGSSGAGKSTLAAALQAKGHPLVSDAMTALRVDQPGPARALAGFRVVKLWPSSLLHLGLEATRRGPVHQQSEKQICAPTGPFAAAETPVRWFVAVQAGEPISLSVLTAAEGLMTLVRNLYLVDDTPASEQPALLQRSGRALREARVASLRRGEELNQLGELVARLEALVRSAPEA
jgi:hypothetical protein